MTDAPSPEYWDESCGHIATYELSDGRTQCQDCLKIWPAPSLPDELCPVCSGPLKHPHDHKPDKSGLDDGPYLPGRGPRKKPEPKDAETIREIRARAWATRRERYGQHGHR